MGEILISIIVPIFNCEKYLEKCIYSILNQSIENIELILVNDGSNDNSLQICEAISCKDNRIRIINKENEGVSKARNVGIDSAQGKYIMFCDSDDYVDNRWCQNLYEQIELDKNSLVISGVHFINQRDNNDNNNKVFSKDEEISYMKKERLFEIYDCFLLNSPCNKIYNSKFIKDNNIKFNEELSLGEDLLFNLEYIDYTNTNIVMVNKSDYLYILRDTESLDNKYYENLYDIYVYLFSELENKLKISGVNMIEIRERLYKTYRGWLIRAIKNDYNENCKDSTIKKFTKTIKKVFSYQFIKCLKNSNVLKDIMLKIIRQKRNKI
ncbi:MAG: glycosyltransferase family 2 protein [Romboutsia sp.]